MRKFSIAMAILGARASELAGLRNPARTRREGRPRKGAGLPTVLFVCLLTCCHSNAGSRRTMPLLTIAAASPLWPT